jgi:aryl-alcohol dehydrogenase-like predicted oxidoreductase
MKLALGTVQLGKEYGIQKNRKPEPEESIQLLDYAVKAGINIFDTAAAYGDAESIIGEFLSKRVERSAIAVITKLPPGVLDGIPTGDYQSAIENEIIKSLCRLNTDYLDGLLFHNAKYVFNANAMDALIQVKRSGVTGKVGISVYTPDEAIKALEYDIDIVQLPYNIFDRRLDQLGFFEQSKARGIAVFARSPLLQGLLAMAPGRIPEDMPGPAADAA